MNDDLEPRLHDALHSGSLPPAPGSLMDALERVPDAPVRLRRRRGARPILGLFAAAAVLLVASAVALTGGSTPRPGPTLPPPSVLAGVPRLHLEYAAQTVDGSAPTPAEMATVASVLRSRIDAMGVAEPTVTTHDLVVVAELPGVVDAADVETVGRMLGHTGKVEFVPLGDAPIAVGEPIDPTKNPPLFGGDQIASATIAADQNGAPAVDFVLKPDGTRLFADYTANHIGSYFAITMDGDVLSAPVIQNAIPNGDIQISGGGLDGLDATHAHGLVALIGSGELPVPLALTSSIVLGLPSADPSVSATHAAPSVAVSSPRSSRLRIELMPVAPGPGDADAMLKAVAIIQTRIANGGVAGATAEVQGSDRIIVELPRATSTNDPLVANDALATLLVGTGRVNLVEIHDGQPVMDVPANPTINPLVLAEDAVQSVSTGVDPAGTATLDLALTQEAAASVTTYAAAHAGSSYEIMLDRNAFFGPVTLSSLKGDVMTVTVDGTLVDPSYVDPSNAHVRPILAVFEAGPLPLDLKIVSTGVILEPLPSAP